MVAIDERKKYLTLEGVRVSYRKKDDTIHLTATDPDVQAGGFHLSLSRGTQTESTLRELLQEHGLIQQHITTNGEPNPGNTWTKRKHRGRIIAVTSAKGGSGKSVLSLMLGSSMHHKQDVGDGYTRRAPRVCVVDLDTNFPSLSALIGQTSPSVFGLAIAGRDGSGELDRYLAEDPDLGISVLLGSHRRSTQEFLTAGDGPEVQPYLTPLFYANVIQRLADEFDVVLVDTDVAYQQPMTQMAYDISDGVIYVAEPSAASLYGLARWVDEVTATKGPGVKLSMRNIGVVVNKAQKDLGVDGALVQKAAREAPIIGVVPMSKAVARGANMGTLPRMIKEEANVRLSLASITDKLAPKLRRD